MLKINEILDKNFITVYSGPLRSTAVRAFPTFRKKTIRQPCTVYRVIHIFEIDLFFTSLVCYCQIIPICVNHVYPIIMNKPTQVSM